MRRRKREEEPDNHERWLVSYADFITLLFAFFTVLYATSPKDVKEGHDIEESIKAAFQNVIDLGGANGGGTFKAFDKNGSLIESPFQVFSRRNISPAEMADALWGVLKKQFDKEKLDASLIELRTDATSVRMSLSAKEFFEPGTAKLNPANLAVLDKFAQVLILADRRITIEGHTDNAPFKSDSIASNWELSANRATTLARFLISRHKFSPKNLVVAAFADQRPLYPNTSEENREKNQRIEIVIGTDPAQDNPEKNL